MTFFSRLLGGASPLQSSLGHGLLLRSLQLLILYYFYSSSSIFPLANAQEKKEYTAKDAGKLRASAETAFASGESEQALLLFSKVIQIEPKNERNYYKRFRVYLSQRKYREAVSDLTAALEIKPSYKVALAQRAKLHRLMGRCEEAVADFTQLAKIDPNSKELGDGYEAAQLCAKAIKTAEEAARRRDWRVAKDQLQAALDLTEVAHDLHVRKAQVCYEMNDHFEVIAESGKAIKLEPEHLEAYKVRGHAYYQLAEVDMSINHFRECLKFDPEHEECKRPYRLLRAIKKHAARAEEAKAEGRARDAIGHWQELVAVDPNFGPVVGPVHVQMAEAWLGLKDFAEAKAAADQAAAHGAGLAALVARGEALLGLEQFEEAVRAFGEARQMDQGNREVHEKLQRAEAALKQSKQKNYYKILGVKRTADKKEIKKQYKLLALEWHPDKHSGKSEEEMEEIEKKFMDIAEAYEVLSDEELRQKYDRGEDVFDNQGGGGGGPRNPFAQHFAHRRGGGGQQFHFHFG
mmetsp:Transcript_36679/g.63651  ORF Transcript_36679/g.63651 Transcript_36679/m.63651 type:complete len:519 (+) Transcript_36679:63-1619(+)